MNNAHLCLDKQPVMSLMLCTVCCCLQRETETHTSLTGFHLQRHIHHFMPGQPVSELIYYGRPNGRPLYFQPVISIFLLLSFFFFISSPNLSGRRLDVYHTSTHGVALVRIYDAGLKPAARGSLEMQDAKMSPKIAIWAPSHNFVGLYLRNSGTYRQSEKNLLSSDMSSTCPHNMVNFGLLTAEIHPVV